MTRRIQLAVAAFAGTSALLWATLALERYHAFHNETFDLAFYARMAWGLVRGSFWEPIVNAHVFGLHISPVLLPLGLLGAVVGDTVSVLLVAQALIAAATAWPLAKMAERRFGPLGALLGAGLWLLYPNLGHVTSYEFHPGTLATLPLAWGCDAIDRRDPRALLGAIVGVLACREDLAMVTALLPLLAWAEPSMRKAVRAAVLLSGLWLALFLFVLHPLFAPAQGSMQLHFGKWGGSLGSAAFGMLTQPVAVLEHLSVPARLSYLPRLLAPLAFLPLLAPRWWLPLLPLLGVNLMSEWPTTIELDSHYQTTALPLLVAAAIEGAGRLCVRVPARLVFAGLGLAALAAQLVAAGHPWSRDFDADVFRADAKSADAAAAVAEVPPEASVQAPYALMPHLAERLRITRLPPPDRDTDYLILDAWHRKRYAGNEDLIRTTEEPIVRDWLARPGYGLVSVHGDYLVLRRGADTRAAFLSPFALPPSEGRGQRIAACLEVLRADIKDDMLRLDLRAMGPCPADLAIRVGTGYRPRRVDLLFAGWLSPAKLEAGDVLRSVHTLSAAERAHIEREGLRVGALRSSGARPEHEDPVAVPVPIERR